MPNNLVQSVADKVDGLGVEGAEKIWDEVKSALEDDGEVPESDDAKTGRDWGLINDAFLDTVADRHNVDRDDLTESNFSKRGCSSMSDAKKFLEGEESVESFLGEGSSETKMEAASADPFRMFNEHLEKLGNDMTKAAVKDALNSFFRNLAIQFEIASDNLDANNQRLRDVKGLYMKISNAIEDGATIKELQNLVDGSNSDVFSNLPEVS